MNFSENTFQQIEDYLNGTMNAEEIKAFENQINENPELAETIEIDKRLKLQYGKDDWDFIKDDKNNKELNTLEALLKSEEFQDKKKAIQSASDSYFNIEKPENSNRSKSKLYSALAIAAALIVFLGIFASDNSLTNQEAFVEYRNWDELPSLVSRSDTNTILLSIGENAFNNKDYKLASESFSSYVNNESEVNITALLHLGISQLELDDYDSAINSFQKIIESNTLDQSKGHWYKTLVYLKMDDRVNAIKELEIIVNNSENFNFAKAEELLKKLKN